MKKEERTIQKIEDDVKSAGQTFLGMRMGDLLCRIPELDDKERKKDLIQEYYENQIDTYDKDFSGTRIRVNAAARIIRGDKVIYALSLIDGSDPRVLPEAVGRAKDTISKIESGEIPLPKLD